MKSRPFLMITTCIVALAMSTPATTAQNIGQKMVLADDTPVDTETRDNLRGALRSTASAVLDIADDMAQIRGTLISCMNDLPQNTPEGVALEGHDRCFVAEAISSREQLVTLGDILTDAETNLHEAAKNYAMHSSQVQTKVDGYRVDLSDIDIEIEQVAKAGRAIKKFLKVENSLSPEQRREALKVAHSYRRLSSRKLAVGTIIGYLIAEKGLYDTAQENLSNAGFAISGQAMGFYTQAEMQSDWIEVAAARQGVRNGVYLASSAKADFSGLQDSLIQLDVIMAAIGTERDKLAFVIPEVSDKEQPWASTTEDEVLRNFLSVISLTDVEIN